MCAAITTHCLGQSILILIFFYTCLSPSKPVALVCTSASSNCFFVQTARCAIVMLEQSLNVVPLLPYLAGVLCACAVTSGSLHTNTHTRKFLCASSTFGNLAKSEVWEYFQGTTIIRCSHQSTPNRQAKLAQNLSNRKLFSIIFGEKLAQIFQLCKHVSKGMKNSFRLKITLKLKSLIGT